jgi:diguanylate cyclase (GGDEF)-like protein/PAS domain S-box-containing protein
VAGPQTVNGGREAMQWDALLRQVANSLPAMIWMCGADGGATLFNKRWLQFTGSAFEQALNGGWAAGVHSDDVARRLAAHREAWQSRAPFETEYRLRRADGEYRWMLDQGAPQFNPQGVFCGYVGVAIDITERKRAEDELRWLSKAVEQSPATVIITDLNGNIEYVNPKFTEVAGYTLDEVRGRNPRILKSGETPAEGYRKLWETIQTGEWRGEFCNRKKNGELYWESASICPIRDETGKPVHFIAVKEDITERKRMEAALQESEERFRIAAETAGICVYDLDLATGKADVYGSDPFLSTLRTVDAWARAIHPDDRERVMAGFGRYRESRKGFRAEYRLVEPDGTVRHYLNNVAPQIDGRWIGSLRDITRNKQAEDALARLAAIVNFSRDAILSLDLESVIQTWNPAAEKLYGYTAAEMVGRPLVALLPPDKREAAGTRVAQVLDGIILPVFETEHLRKGGGVFPVSVVASPIKDAQGRVVGDSAIVRDITGQKRAHEALMESENRFRALLQNSNDIITLTDRAGIVLYDSPGVTELLGVTPEQRLGCDSLQWIHPDDLSYLRMVHDELLCAPGSRLRAQLRVRHADGSWRWCDSWATNLLDEPGLRAVVVSCRDITELKGVETALRESEQRYRKLFEDATDVIFTLDLDGNFTSVNAMGEQISGYCRQELLCMNLQQLASPESLAGVHHAITARTGGEKLSALEADFIARDGHRVAMEVNSRLQFRNGLPVGMLCIARDISQRKRVERLEDNRREVLEMVAQNQPLDAVLGRVEQMIEHYFPGTVARIRLTDGSAAPECALGRNDPASANYQGHMDVPIRAGDGRVLGNLRISRPEPWQATESEQILMDSKAKLASIALEHRQLTNRLAHQAQHDALTGLPNRTLLDDRLRQALTLARRLSKMVAVLYVDLDRFKFINDTLGHHVGDLLLQQAAKRLESAVRESDTLARSGGDEFVAVLFGVETLADAEVVGERIIETMRDPFLLEGHELFVSASVGLSVFPADGEDAATLQKHADVAMYEAKNLGRNRFQRFARELNSASSERLEIESQLHRALDRGELQLYYQPQFQLPSRRLGGMEALLRWNHPKRGLLLPGRFVPVAEESGLIIPISLWILEEACRQHQSWRRAGYPPVKIAVNISATQFMRSNLAEKVAEVLEAHEMEPCYLEVELTEGVLMRDAEDSARQIAELRDLGVRISIDDFGTGYSSLSYLQRLPLDDLKIDRCFVSGIDRATSTQPLVQAIVGLAHGLNLTATAEGVETENELAVLEALGCDQIQGFLLGRPVAADQWENHWQAGGDARRGPEATPCQLILDPGLPSDLPA